MGSFHGDVSLPQGNSCNSWFSRWYAWKTSLHDLTGILASRSWDTQKTPHNSTFQEGLQIQSSTKSTTTNTTTTTIIIFGSTINFSHHSCFVVNSAPPTSLLLNSFSSALALSCISSNISTSVFQKQNPSGGWWKPYETWCLNGFLHVVYCTYWNVISKECKNERFLWKWISQLFERIKLFTQRIGGVPLGSPMNHRTSGFPNDAATLAFVDRCAGRKLWGLKRKDTVLISGGVSAAFPGGSI